MNTRSKSADSHAVTEFRDAIQKHVLIREADGAHIVGNEQTGARDEWIFDFRALLLQAKWLDRYAELFWERYAHKLPFQVAGVETAGIPLVAAIVMKSVERGTPINGFYLRKSRKRVGLMKYIEGTPTNEPIVFVDDLVNSGQSIRKQVDILAREYKTVTDAFVILSLREDSAYAHFAERNISLARLFTLADFNLKPLPASVPETNHDAFETLWHFEAPHPSMHLVVQKSTPVLDEKYIYYGSDSGEFRALDQKSGALVWTFSVGKHPEGKGILSSPALHDGKVFFGAYDGGVYALECATGSLVWRNDDADWVGSSPAVAAELGVLFIGLEFGSWKRRGGIAAIDLYSGKTIWTAYHPSLTHGSPLYIKEENLVVVGSNNGYLFAYDATTGAQKWTFNTSGDIKMRPAYDPKRRAIACASMSGIIFSISAPNGSPIFAREFGAGIYSSPLVHEDTIYVASLDKHIYAISAATGANIWEYATSGRIFASPTITGSSIWIGSNDCRLYELDARSGRMRSFFQATERIVNAVAIQNDSIFVPTVANELYCIKKKSQQ